MNTSKMRNKVAPPPSPLLAPPYCSASFLELPVRAEVPPVEFWRARNEADYYGASFNIATQLGRRRVPHSYAEWTHGWINMFPVIHPELIVDSDCQQRRWKTYLVHTDENAQLLREHGYTNVEAVGMPYLYAADRPDIERRPGTLLVMPTHGIDQGELSQDQRTYVDAILDLKKDFETICFCLHEHTVRSTRLTDHLDRYGIPWVQGAGAKDRQSHNRLRVLFRSFEFMTTNSPGSHLPYATGDGCRVSLWGEFYSRTKEELADTLIYRTYPQILDHIAPLLGEDFARKRFPWGFVDHPRQAVTAVEWGLKEMGAENRREPEELARYLGWGWVDQGYYGTRKFVKDWTAFTKYQINKRILRRIPASP